MAIIRRVLILLTLTAAICVAQGASPAAADVPRSPSAGYWMLDLDGRIYSFGEAMVLPAANVAAGATAVKLVTNENGTGVWVTDSIGNITVYGTAQRYGSRPNLDAGESIVSMVLFGDGYWLVSSAGRTFNYGDANPVGDVTDFTPNHVPLNQPIIDASFGGGGIYLVGLDGGVFPMAPSHRQIVFYGSTGGMRLNSPVRSLVQDPDGEGYWLVAGDGGVFSFSADFKGSMGSTPLNAPIIGMVPYGDAYLQVASDGGVFNFATNRAFLGSLGGQHLPAPIVGIAAYSLPLTITTTSLPPATRGVPYQFVLTADGLSGDEIWEVTGLPDGLTRARFDNRLIEGIPSCTAVTSTVHILSHDRLSQTSRDLVLTVLPGPSC